MPAGRPAKPLSQKLLAGNPGKRPLNEAAPKIPLGKPERGKYLRSKAARRAFAKLADLMAAWLTPLDGPMFNVLCYEIYMYELAAEELNRTGPVIEETRATKSGETYTVEVVSPWWQVLQNSAEKILSYSQKLAISVHDRERLVLALPPAKKDEMEELLERKGVLRMPAPEDIEIADEVKD